MVYYVKVDHKPASRTVDLKDNAVQKRTKLLVLKEFIDHTSQVFKKKKKKKKKQKKSNHNATYEFINAKQ